MGISLSSTMESWKELGGYLYYILPFILAAFIGSSWNKKRQEKFERLPTEEKDQKMYRSLLILASVVGIPAFVCIYLGRVRGGDTALIGWVLLFFLSVFLISFIHRERLKRMYPQEKIGDQLRTLVPLSKIKRRLGVMRVWSWLTIVSYIVFFVLAATLIGTIAVYKTFNPQHALALFLSIPFVFLTGLVQSLLSARFEVMRQGTTFMVHCDVCGKNSPFRVENMPEISDLLVWQYIPLYFLYKTSSTAKYTVSCNHCGNSTK